ncbi:MAG: hypothetical protein R2741_10920 [Methanolobus sp.]
MKADRKEHDLEKINTVPTSEELLDKAFRRASRAMSGKKITGRKTALEAKRIHGSDIC